MRRGKKRATELFTFNARDSHSRFLLLIKSGKVAASSKPIEMQTEKQIFEQPKYVSSCLSGNTAILTHFTQFCGKIEYLRKLCLSRYGTFIVSCKTNRVF